MARRKVNYDFSHLSSEQLAWAAGFVDGEGCITFAKHHSWGSRAMLLLSVTNTNKDVIQLFKDWFGCGSVRTQKQDNPNWKDRHSWVVRAKAAEMVIRAIRPYLKLKTNQADYALRLRESKDLSVEDEVILINELRSFNGRRSVYAALEVA